MKYLALVFIFAFLSLPVFAQKGVSQFKNYPAGKIYKGKNAPIRLSREDKMFRTRLTQASKQKPNFAGHYVLTFWGCGTECRGGAVIDVKTGKVTHFDFSLCCWEHYGDDKFEPIDFRIDSKLIIFTGLRNEKEGDDGAHFYKFENGRFIFIKTLSDKKSK